MLFVLVLVSGFAARVAASEVRGELCCRASAGGGGGGGRWR